MKKMRLLLMGMTMTFGKYKGKTIEEVYRTNPSYFSWMRENGMINKPEFQKFVETVGISAGNVRVR